MAVDLKAYQIFLSYPSGLEAEKDAIREFIEKYNIREANCRNVHFLVLCWKDLPSRYGDPQDFINERLCGCDYFILILCDRWGSPPGAGHHANYTSGTEEEFDLAIRCCKGKKYPMRDIAVYFKSVDKSKLARLESNGQLNEEDKQLKRVLDFKARLTNEKELLYGDFDDKSELEDKIWTHLAQWRREHEDRLEPRGVKNVHDVAKLPAGGPT
jgi:hypothetical protein